MSPVARAFFGDGFEPPRELKLEAPASKPKVRAPAGEPTESSESTEATEPTVAEALAAEPTVAKAPATESAVAAEAPNPAAGPQPAEPRAEPEEEAIRAPAPTPPPHVLIVGGGGTGAALAHDLVLRGLRVTLVERGEVVSGTTGRHHGLLHSGARYATTDRAAAIECSAENKILRRIAPGSFEENDGLFVALTEEDADFESEFLEACWQTAVPTRRIDRALALRLEPGLSPDVRLAVQVPDATMDAMRLPLRFLASARRGGAEVLPFTEVTGVTVAGRAVQGVSVRDHASGREYDIGADIVVNAAGPWVGKVAAMANVEMSVAPSGGVLVAVRGRQCNMVVSRLHSPGDGDLVLPQRRMTVLGTTSWPVDDPDDPGVPADQVEAMVRETSMLLPAIRGAEIRAAWSAVRPLIRDEAADGRSSTRETRCFDHATDRAPTEGFVTIAGGKATTLRAMAETTADLVCAKLGVERRCKTRETVLLPHTAWYSR